MTTINLRIYDPDFGSLFSASGIGLQYSCAPIELVRSGQTSGSTFVSLILFGSDVAVDNTPELSGVGLNSLLTISQRNSVQVVIEGWGETRGVR